MSKTILLLYVMVIGAIGVATFNAKGYEYFGVAIMSLSGFLAVLLLARFLTEQL